MVNGMIGRKVGMMRLYDGAGRARAVTVIEVGPNRVTQLRTTERDGYEAVQLAFAGTRKRTTRAMRGHLRKAGVDESMTSLHEFPLDGDTFERGQTITVEAFTPGEYVDVSGVSKGRGWAGGVKRWHFRGGPKTHGQSDRHRAPGSVGSGTTPGKVWKGQKMAGHMGDRTSKVMNVLVVLTDPVRNLLFVEGSVPGAVDRVVTITRGRRPALRNFLPPTLPVRALDEDDEEDEAATESPDSAESADSPDSPDVEEAGADETDEGGAGEPASEEDGGEKELEAPAPESETRQ
jgi:large subunit ribosomal protein L3